MGEYKGPTREEKTIMNLLSFLMEVDPPMSLVKKYVQAFDHAIEIENKHAGRIVITEDLRDLDG